MRTAHRMTILSGLVIALAACNGSGNSSGGSGRQAMLDAQIDGCMRSAQQAGQPPAGVDVRAVCGCAINRVTEGKSDDEVRTMFNRAPIDSEIAMTRNCMMEAVQGATKK